MGRKKILVIPHIGTAFGHLIRTAAIISDRYKSNSDIIVEIPKSVLSYAKKMFSSKVRFIPIPIRPTVTSRSGGMDIQGFSKLLAIDEYYFDLIQPDLIFCDPGIRGGILAEKKNVPWEAIMHGCYLPFPQKLFSGMNEKDPIYHLASRAWTLVQSSLNELVKIGTDERIKTWEELRRTGKILIPNSSLNEPAEIGEYIDGKYQKKEKKSKKKYKAIITTCSSGDVSFNVIVLNKLVEIFGEVAVLGRCKRVDVNGVHFFNERIDLLSAINCETVIFCHGGHGTLRVFSETSNKVIAIPGDIDQLCNSIIAKMTWGCELAIGKKWIQRLAERKPFKRLTEWEDLLDYINEWF